MKPAQILSDTCKGLTVNLDSGKCTQINLVGNKAKSLYLLKKAIADDLIDDVSFEKQLLLLFTSNNTYSINDTYYMCVLGF